MCHLVGLIFRQSVRALHWPALVSGKERDATIGLSSNALTVHPTCAARLKLFAAARDTASVAAAMTRCSSVAITQTDGDWPTDEMQPRPRSLAARSSVMPSHDSP